MIAQSVDSALAQDFGNFEVIVSDDGSTDNTVEVLSGYGERILVVKGPHECAGAARSRGIQEARSPLVAFHDSDDIMLPGRLAAQVAFMHRHPEVAAVYGNAIIEGVEDVDYFGICGIEFGQAQWIIPDKAFEKLLLRSFVVDSCAMVRRERFFEVGGFDMSLRAAAEWDLWLRMSRKWPLACMKKSCVRVGMHDGKILDSPIHIASVTRVIDKNLRIPEPIDPLVLNAILERLYDRLKRYIVSNFRAEVESGWRSRAMSYAAHLPFHRRTPLRVAASLPYELGTLAIRLVDRLRKRNPSKL